MAVALAGLALDLAGGGFPATFHPAELRLARIVAGGTSDWSDPALATHLGRAAAALLEINGTDAITRTGRGLAALFGALSVLLLWRLLRDALRPRAALFGAALAAVSPLLVSHAHYFTPDTLALFLALAALLCLTRVLEGGKAPLAAVLGLAVGLACSALYGGLLLVLTCLTVPAVERRARSQDYQRSLAQAGLVAAAVFVALDYPLFLDPGQILAGPWHELRRFALGDHLFVPGHAHGFTFHLRESLAPGFTWPVIAATVAGIGAAVARRRNLPTTARIVFLYGALAYLLAEISPRKPHPGFVRYMLPVIPAVALACGLALEALEERLAATPLRWVAPAVLALLLALPALRSFELIARLGDDTRLRADAWTAENAGRVLREPHSSAHPHDFASLAAVDLDAARRSGVTHVTTSSFTYDTFARGSRLAGQHDYVYERHERYQELFGYPYEEFAPKGPTLGWSNPTVRVLDIREPQPPGRP